MLAETELVQVQAYLDGELPRPDALALERRVAGSAGWREATRAVGDLLGDCAHALAVARDDGDSLFRASAAARAIDPPALRADDDGAASRPERAPWSWAVRASSAGWLLVGAAAAAAALVLGGRRVLARESRVAAPSART